MFYQQGSLLKAKSIFKVKCLKIFILKVELKYLLKEGKYLTPLVPFRNWY
jgi:hypothetical protein